MANRTVKDAKSIRGTNPQYLVEKIIRARIYDSKYWKEECFALTAELLVDKAMELRLVTAKHNLRFFASILFLFYMYQIAITIAIYFKKRNILNIYDFHSGSF